MGTSAENQANVIHTKEQQEQLDDSGAGPPPFMCSGWMTTANLETGCHNDKHFMHASK